MKLARATFLGIRGLPDLSLDFTNAETGAPFDVVVVTGPLESGKTRVLEAILAAKDVLAPYDVPPEDGQAWVVAGGTAKVELTFVTDAVEQKRYGVAATAFAEALFTMDHVASEADDALVAMLAEYEHDTRTGTFEYFAATRGLAQHVSPLMSAEDQGQHRTSASPAKYAFVPAFLATLSKDEPTARRFAVHLEKLCPRLAYVAPKSGDPARCISASGRAPCLVGELSTTEADAVIIAATAALVRFDRSILLVDRPELSADEATFSSWLTGARALGEDVQLVLASASPAVVASVDKAAVFRMPVPDGEQ